MYHAQSHFIVTRPCMAAVCKLTVNLTIDTMRAAPKNCFCIVNTFTRIGNWTIHQYMHLKRARRFGYVVLPSQYYLDIIRSFWSVSTTVSAYEPVLACSSNGPYNSKVLSLYSLHIISVFMTFSMCADVYAVTIHLYMVFVYPVRALAARRLVFSISFFSCGAGALAPCCYRKRVTHIFSKTDTVNDNTSTIMLGEKNVHRMFSDWIHWIQSSPVRRTQWIYAIALQASVGNVNFCSIN